jgi:hypothetical protein
MKSVEKIADYFTRLATITNQMKNSGEIMDEQVVIDKVLCTHDSKI